MFFRALFAFLETPLKFWVPHSPTPARQSTPVGGRTTGGAPFPRRACTICNSTPTFVAQCQPTTDGVEAQCGRKECGGEARVIGFPNARHARAQATPPRRKLLMVRHLPHDTPRGIVIPIREPIWEIVRGGHEPDRSLTGLCWGRKLKIGSKKGKFG